MNETPHLTPPRTSWRSVRLVAYGRSKVMPLFNLSLLQFLTLQVGAKEVNLQEHLELDCFDPRLYAVTLIEVRTRISL